MTARSGPIKKHYLFAVFLLIAAVLLFKKSDGYFGWTKTSSKEGTVLISDGAAYYSYLPHWFIYDSEHFEFMDTVAKRYNEPGFSQNIHHYPGTKTLYNKYYTGTAIAQSPFFAIAHLVAKVGSYPADGYSKPYLLLVNCAAIFYVLAGCLAIYLLLIRLGVQKKWAIAAIVCLVFGTNLSYYSCFAPACSHAFSFGIIAWILNLVHLLSRTYNRKNWYWLCFLFGLALVIRPTNALVLLFLPFLFESRSAFFAFVRSQLKTRRMQLIVGVLLVLLFILFQCYTTWSQIGKWRFGGYPDEGFDFLFQPKIWQVLFSWDKGLFIFAPVLILIVPGLVLLFRQQRRLFWGVSIFFLVFTWITASWWCWWYGGGLGMRPYIEFFPVLVIPVAFLFERFSSVNRVVLMLFAGAACWMYSIYEWQFRHNILHYDRMTYEDFSHVFLKTDLRFSWGMHMEYERLPLKKSSSKKVVEMQSADGQLTQTTRMSGDNPGDNPAMTIYREKDLQKLFGLRLTGQFYLYSGETNPYVEATYFKNGTVSYWHQYYLGQFIPTVEKWSRVKLELYPPEHRQDFDSLHLVIQEANTYTGMKDWKAEINYYAKSP